MIRLLIILTFMMSSSIVSIAQDIAPSYIESKFYQLYSLYALNCTIVAATLEDLHFDELHYLEQSYANTLPEEKRPNFIYTRALAQRALKQMKRLSVPILENDKGAPILPKGLAGSATLTQKLGVVVLAPLNLNYIQAVGIELVFEPELQPTDPHTILSDDDIAQFPHSFSPLQTYALGLACKETFRKSQFLITNQNLDYLNDIKLILFLENCEFYIQANVGIQATFIGKYQRINGYIFAIGVFAKSD